MPDDVLDHDDGVVDDEADRDRERHQGQIVEAVAQHVHHGECADDGYRHRNRGNDGRPKLAQEERDDANDEGDRQQQGEAHVGEAGRDGLGSVGDDLDVDARRQRGPELRQGFLDRRDRRHDIGAGRPKNGQQNSRLAVEPSCNRLILGRLDRPPDVADANWRAVAIGDDRVVKALSRHQLVIRLKRDGLLTAVEQARRLNDGQVRQRKPDRFEIKVYGGELGRVELDSDRRTFVAADGHEADAGDLRKLLRQDRVGIVADRHDRQHVGRQRYQQDRRVGRIGLAIDRQAQERDRQLRLRGVDRRLHVLGGRNRRCGCGRIAA